MWREWKTEWMKVRYRKIGLIVLAFLGMIILWVAWILSRNDMEQLQDGYELIF